MHEVNTPMTNTYESETEFLQAIAKQEPIAALDQTTREGLLNGIEQATASETEDQIHAGQELRLGRWFIRNDDLPFLELIAATTGIILVTSASGGIVAAALTAKIAGFIAGVWKLWRKGAILNESQLAVLAVLYSEQSQTVETLAETLKPTEVKLNAQQLVSVLESLTKLELYDGTEVELVRMDQNGWRSLRI